MTSVDLMFPCHNRLEYVKAAFQNLLDNTDWTLVKHLWLVDDDSTDGTAEYLKACEFSIGYKATLARGNFGGPVAAMNHVLDRTHADVIAKIDSDCIVPPGWLNTMLGVLDEHPNVDALGMEPAFADPLQPDYVKRTCKPARWVGGQGLIRTSVFAKHRPVAKRRYFGWTQFQRQYVCSAWVSPDIAAFNLDHLPFEPWKSLAAEYVENGWSRAWGPYDQSLSPYWDWWTKQQEAVA